MFNLINKITIEKVTAIEVLDSRSNPTVKATVHLSNGQAFSAATPSGASTGIHEAVELRDNNSKRYRGKGVQTAIYNIEKKISPRLKGISPISQKEIDTAMLELDGTANKSKLGANAILAVSLATTRAGAAVKKQELFRYINDLAAEGKDATDTRGSSDNTGTDKQESKPITHETDSLELNVLHNTESLPTPMFNIINGGAHATNDLAVQEFMIVPTGIKTLREKVHAASNITHTLKKILTEKKLSTGVGDEGGFAPNLKSEKHAMDLLVHAIEQAGYKPDEEIKISLDVAISTYIDKGKYEFPYNGKNIKKVDEILEAYEDLCKKYPMLSIEDGLGEDDWKGWEQMYKKLDEHNVLCVGDDFTVTNPERLKRALDPRTINALIIKPNQIGTITEVLKVVDICNQNNVKKIISHRSGETCDTFIADLAVGVNAEYFKCGAPVRSERVAKYNRLMEIEKEMNLQNG